MRCGLLTGTLHTTNKFLLPCAHVFSGVAARAAARCPVLPRVVPTTNHLTSDV